VIDTLFTFSLNLKKKLNFINLDNPICLNVSIVADIQIEHGRIISTKFAFVGKLILSRYDNFG